MASSTKSSICSSAKLISKTGAPSCLRQYCDNSSLVDGCAIMVHFLTIYQDKIKDVDPIPTPVKMSLFPESVI